MRQCCGRQRFDAIADPLDSIFSGDPNPDPTKLISNSEKFNCTEQDCRLFKGILRKYLCNQQQKLDHHVQISLQKFYGFLC
jgi:hypothetical protein